jgi:hypothetical protein
MSLFLTMLLPSVGSQMEVPMQILLGQDPC